MKLLSLLQGRQMAIDCGLRVEHATLEAFSAGANETPDAARRRLKEWYLAADAARDGRSREGHRSETGEDSPD